MAKQLGALRFKGKLANVVGYKNTSGANSTNPNFMRERVYDVNNPQTYAQSAQRSKMKPAQLFYAAFEPVLNHAFIPAGKASRNRNRFMSLALRNDVPSNLRGETIIPLMEYQIAEGALGLDRYTVGVPSAEAVSFPIVAASANTIGELSAAILANNVGLVAGEELTFLAIVAIGGDSEARYAAHFSFILNPDDAVNSLGNIVPSGLSLGVADGMLVLEATDDNVLLAAGLIISSKTTASYIYTNSSMVLTTTGVDFGRPSMQVISSYMKGAGDHSSDLILQQATNAQAGNVVVPVSIYQKSMGDPNTGVVLVQMSDGSERLLVLDAAGTLAKESEPGVVKSAGVTAAEIGLAGSPTISLADAQRYISIAFNNVAITSVSIDGNVVARGSVVEDAGNGLVKITLNAPYTSGALDVTLDGNPVTLTPESDNVVQFTTTVSGGVYTISDAMGLYCTIEVEARP